MKRSTYPMNYQTDRFLNLGGQQSSPVSGGRSPHLLASIAQLLRQLSEQLSSLSHPSELRVWTRVMANGEIVWSAYDPRTNRSIFDVTETEVRQWVEQRYAMPYQPRAIAQRHF